MKKNILIACLAALSFTACKKIKVEAPSFDVTTAKTTYKVGDTVLFNFIGNPDLITVYQGVPGADYTNRTRTTADGTPNFNFTSYIQNAGEANTLRVMISTNFNGNYDAAGIAAATWTDITSSATLSTGTDNTASGTIDLTPYKVAGKSTYIAYKYVGYNHATLKQPTWTIRTFNVNNVLANGLVSVVSAVAQIGWKAVDIKNPTVFWSTPATGQASINGTVLGSTADDNEDWIISRPLNLSAVTPDAGLGLKNGSTYLPNYSYKYTTAGTYTATFIARNTSVDESAEVVKQIQLTIAP